MDRDLILRSIACNRTGILRFYRQRLADRCTGTEKQTDCKQGCIKADQSISKPDPQDHRKNVKQRQGKLPIGKRIHAELIATGTPILKPAGDPKFWRALDTLFV